MLTAFGLDRPGIVFRITSELAKLECNLSDSAMTDLEGQFVIMLSFSRPMGLTKETIETMLRTQLEDLELQIQVSSVVGDSRVELEEKRQIAVRVFGADKLGIVAEITKVLFEYGANIIDLKTHLTNPKVSPNYLLIVLAEVSFNFDIEPLEAALAAIAKRLSVHMSLDVVVPDTL